MRIVIATLAALVIAVGPGAYAGNQAETNTKREVPEIRAVRINMAQPKIDGNLDDAAWQDHVLGMARGFTQREPDDGLLPTESTVVAIRYDDEALYFAWWCYDSEPDRIDAQLVRRDRWSQSDYIALRLDPYHDHLTGYGFQVTAAGVLRDRQFHNDDNVRESWDAVWEGAARVHPWGWAVEMKIPFCCLRFPDQDVHTWGIDFARLISRKNEAMRWSYTPQSVGGLVSNFGHLTGLEGIRPTRHMEVMPYVVSSLETEPTSLSNPDGRDFLNNGGFDCLYSISSNLTLNATLNPDFGQVELDNPILNLSAYETYFSEKRPFFLEGADLFDTDFTLFYSRRIGRAPSGGIDDDELDYYTSYPKATTILGAAKLTGKLAGGTSIAVLTAVTEEETAEYAAVTNVVTDSTGSGDDLVIDTLSADTLIRSGVVEPTAGYTVVRVKQDLFGTSYVGGLLTLASQDQRYPATTGGVDWWLKTSDGVWRCQGQAILSRTDPDRVGHGFNITLEKASGEHVRGAIGGTFKNPDLDISRLGYTSRADSRHTWAWVQYRTLDDWWIVRNSWNNLNFYTSWNYAGYNYTLGGNFNAYLEFINYWSLGYGIEIQGEKYNDLETRGNGIWEWPARPTLSWWFSLDTDARKSVSFNWNPGGGTDRGGHWWANYVGVEYRPRSNMEFELGTNYIHTHAARRWVENESFDDADSSVFALLHRDQLSLYASAGVVVNPNLSMQLSASGLISGLDYRDYRFYQGNRNYGPALDGYNHDYSYAALNSTFLIRWEYRPGSTIYMVWTRAREDVNDAVNNLEMSRDFDRLFSGGADNLFMIKASYWLNI